MREVEDTLPSAQSSTRIAILAAMSITDDLFSSKREKKNVIDQVEDKAAALVEILDESLVSG